MTVLVGTTWLPGAAAQASFPGPNGRIAFALDRNIATMRADGSVVRMLTHVAEGTFAGRPSWSPTGGGIVFDLAPSGPLNVTQIWRMNADGSGQRRLVADPFFNDFGPSYSPDGTKVVFTRCHPQRPRCALYRVNADGTHLTGLTPFEATTSQPVVIDFDASYSPDGRQIAFESFRGGVLSAIYVMRADGTGIHRVTPAWIKARGPDWSPDGRRLVFYNCCVTGSSRAIWQIAADGSGLVQLTRPGDRQDYNPAYSPNGRQVAFERWAPDFSSHAVWVMNTDGSNQRQVGPPLSGQSAWGSAR